MSSRIEQIIEEIEEYIKIQVKLHFRPEKF